MVNMIQHHIQVFGGKFIAVEFGLVALLGVFLVIFSVMARQFGLVVVSIGITLNSLVVVGYGLQAINGKLGKALQSTESNRALVETLILSVTIILPFVLLILVGYERITSRLS
ncbi:MAG: hypothetical protein H0X30_20525 [Anaerolineae bacterium]|nr:hypothetical protein [Anaerolineae bacterium]